MRISAAVSALFLFRFMQAGPVFGQSVDQIVSRALDAKGGSNMISSIEAERLEGSIRFGGGRENPFTVDIATGGKIRQEIDFGGKRFVSVYDGGSGWIMNPFRGDTVRKMTPDEERNSLSSADITGPLFNYRKRGTTIVMAGRSSVRGRENYRLAITMQDGTERTDYIDCKTFLESKWLGYVLSDGKRSAVESYFEDYRKVDGLMFAFRIESGAPHGGHMQEIVFKTIEINPVLPDSLFMKP